MDQPTSTRPQDGGPKAASRGSAEAGGGFGARLPRTLGVIVAIAAVLLAINWAKAVLMPVAVALLLHIVFAPAVRAAKRLHVPPGLSALAIVLLLLGGMITVVWQLAGPVSAWAERLPEAVPRIEAKVRELRAPLRVFENASEQVERITGSEGDAATRAFPVQLQRRSLSEVLLTEMLGFVVSGGMVLLTLYFLLAAEGAFLRRLVHLLPRFEDKRQAVEVFHRVERDVSRYLQTTVLVGLGVGVAEGFAMASMGMPNPLLWAALGAVLNWIPYVGALVGTVLVGAAALLTFDGAGYALLVTGVFYAITSIEGSVITPLILGRRLTLNPVVLFLWLALWSWMWGLVGSLIAVPLLSAIRILCDHFESLHPLGEFLTRAEPRPAPEPPHPAPPWPR
jgi:predicted PurR-regulated permease PerM